MSTTQLTADDCEHPHCDDRAVHTYRDPSGNSIQLCAFHYHRAVADGNSPDIPSTDDGDVVFTVDNDGDEPDDE